METTVPVCQTADIQLREKSVAQVEEFKHLRILSVSEGRLDQVQDGGQSACRGAAEEPNLLSPKRLQYKLLK